jgi:hypothetical protein
MSVPYNLAKGKEAEEDINTYHDIWTINWRQESRNVYSIKDMFMSTCFIHNKSLNQKMPFKVVTSKTSYIHGLYVLRPT